MFNYKASKSADILGPSSISMSFKGDSLNRYFLNQIYVEIYGKSYGNTMNQGKSLRSVVKH